MAFVRTKAQTFFQLVHPFPSSWPCLPRDEIVLFPPRSAWTERLRRLPAGALAEAFSHLHRRELRKWPFFVIDHSSRRIRYASVSRIPVPVDRPPFLPLTEETQEFLKKAVTSAAVECSGWIDASGRLRDVHYGKLASVPMSRDIPKNALPFHTHPRKTYLHFHTNVGWPSPDDIRWGPATQLVASVEGMYLVMNTACHPPKKEAERVGPARLKRVLEKCKWILLPWDTRVWFLHVGP